MLNIRIRAGRGPAMNRSRFIIDILQKPSRSLSRQDRLDPPKKGSGLSSGVAGVFADYVSSGNNVKLIIGRDAPSTKSKQIKICQVIVATSLIARFYYLFT